MTRAQQATKVVHMSETISSVVVLVGDNLYQIHCIFDHILGLIQHVLIPSKTNAASSHTTNKQQQFVIASTTAGNDRQSVSPARVTCV